jgi:DNA-binding XRE family transcriptional regulator
MTYHPQKVIVPDGTAMVLITEDEYLDLIAAKEDADDLAKAAEALRDMKDRPPIPADVSRNIRKGVHPVAAWRTYHGLTQSALAKAAGLTQPAITRIEKAAAGAGTHATLAKLAAALDAPIWSLEGHD